MGHLVNIDLFAQRCRRLGEIPKLVPCDTPLLGWLADEQWPLGKVDRTRLVDVDEVVFLLPFILAKEAIADGASATGVLTAFADALDPPP